MQKETPLPFIAMARKGRARKLRRNASMTPCIYGVLALFIFHAALEEDETDCCRHD